MDVTRAAAAAREASRALAAAGTDLKNRALQSIRQALLSNGDSIEAANLEDMRAAEAGGLAYPLLKRLRFDHKKLQETARSIESLIALEDPVGRTLLSTELDKGLELYRVSCPIGVIGVVFESRPDALVQISTLCLKSGNAVLLKGGSEARQTNAKLAEVIYEAGLAEGLPAGWLTLLETRSDVSQMLGLDEYIDLIIPRGSNEFVRHIMQHSRIPVMGHADGICHVYVDKDADLEMALRVAVDSKTQYVAVCNAAETLLVHRDIAGKFLPELKKAMDEKGVELIGCQETASVIPVLPATDESYRTEYLDYRMSVRVVPSAEEAIAHINAYGSGHTDAIITRNMDTARLFASLVDSGNIMLNCSTRFSDGFRYGFGAEVGISTGKIHARGPVGMDGLVIYKYILLGSGQTVEEYCSGQRSFTHRRLDKRFDL